MSSSGRRSIVRLLSAVLGFAVVVGSAQAQVASPLRATQRSEFSDAQLAQFMATATPMELLARDNPLQAAQGTALQRSQQSAGEPAMTWGRAGRADRGGWRMGRSTAGSRSTPVRRSGRTVQGFNQGQVQSQSNEDIAPQNFGQGNQDSIYHYNDYQQVPAPIWYAPYRQTGRYLFQAADGLWYTCTAALINQAILLTAGHCVHDGNGTTEGWNLDGYFYPAFSNRYDDNNQRYGRCQTSYYSTTFDWYTNGAIQQGSDVAMALCGRLQDGAWNFAQNRLPGEVLGYYGFCYENCVSGYNFLTQLGYPSNYHNGRQMTVSQHLEETSLTGGADFLYGTGMRGGSSGGPHIQNIGNLWDHSTDVGQVTYRNTIFAVTSWGYVSESIKLQGSSPISGVNNANGAASMYNLICEQSRNLFGSGTCDLLPT